MQQHYKILGILYLVYGGLLVLIGFAIGSILEVVAGMNSVNYEEEMVLNIVSTAVPVALFILSLPNLIAGFGLLNRKRWALIMGVILSIFNIMNIPFGMGLSIYSIYVLIKDEEQRKRDVFKQQFSGE